MGKHLSLSDRITIESKLNEGISFRKIKGYINKPHTTILREVEKRRVFVRGNF